jgi:predicted nucleotide-binding protein
MEKKKIYHNTCFPTNVLNKAYEVFLSKLDHEKAIGIPNDLTVEINGETWKFDSIEEFFADYPKSLSYRFDHIAQGNRIIFSNYDLNSVYVVVSFANRSQIEAVFQVFDQNAIEYKRPRENPKVFIGHGRDQQWRDLKDHLQDKHGIDVIAYEVGPRAGLSIKEVLEDMLESSSFALLVLTGEDVHNDGEIHARENVIHEVGLFQGKLGFENAIVLLEEGVKEFTNILGVNQIRFSKGGIRETFGDVIATINRGYRETGNY